MPAMPQAPVYTPAATFADDERNNVGGRSTVQTAELDAEFGSVQSSVNTLRTNQSLNQRDDGEIRDGRVKLHTLATDVLAYLTAIAGVLRGPWVTTTAYSVKDVVTQSSNTYICAVAHTSGVFATDLAASKWVLLTLGNATAASAVVFTPSATLAAANVQAAIEEADTENRTLSAAASAAVSALAVLLAGFATNVQGAGNVGVDDTLDYVAVASRSVGVKLSETISLRRDLAPGNGVADDTPGFAALVAAVNASTAKAVNVKIPGGDYRVSSATIAAAPLLFTRGNVKVEGRGKPTITVTGAAVTDYIFGSVGRSDIAYRSIRFVGNNAANAYGNGVALRFTNNSTADIANFRVKDCEFDNFKGDYWIYAECLGNKAIRKIYVNRNEFISRTTNARGPANIAINSSFVGIVGNAANATSFVQGVSVQDNEMDADYIKCGVQIFHFVKDFHVTRNDVRNAGALEVSNDCGAYALILYASGVNVGSRGRVTHNIITAPRSCGVYLANSWVGTVIADNEVSGQTDTVVATLPKGGIVLNGGQRISVRGNTITTCAAAGIWWGPGTAGDARIKINDNVIDGCLLQGILLQSAAVDARNVSVQNNTITECLDGIYLDLYTTATITNVLLSGNQIRSVVAASRGIVVVSTDASYKLAELHIQGGTIKAVASGIVAQNITTGQVHIGGGISIAGPYSGYGLSVNGSTKLVIDGVKFSAQTTGFALRTALAQGTLRNISFSADCLTACLVENSGGEDLGRSTPTWVPTASGAVVQNILPVEAGAAASKYVNREWIYTTGGAAWLQQRMLTGN